MAKLKLRDLKINKDWCKGCGICITFCPTKLLELHKREKATEV